MRMQLQMIILFFIVAISIVKSDASGCALVECPSMNGHYATLHPNTLDSGSYCVCDWGGVIQIPCNKGLLFDPITVTCKLPQENNEIDLNYCNSVFCSPDDCGLIVPHPTECNSFCKCINETAQYFQCPDGLYYNPVLEVCDFKSHVQCNTIEVDLTGCEDVKCPTENTDVLFLLPNPKDCGSYCQCNWGTPIYMQCPPGLYFNAAQNICDYPTEAQCNLNAKPLTESYGSNDVIATENSSTMFSTSKPQFNGCEYVSCPAINGEYALFLANPYDCGSFCTCNWGEAIYTSCSPGLHFNSELMLCDWPENARCVETSINLEYDAEANTDIPRPPDTGVDNDIMITGCENIICPAPTGVYKLPNPIDCGSYCKCDNGAIFHVKCRDDLHFNSNLEMCDKPQFANCPLKSSTTNLATKSTQIISDESTITSTTVTEVPTTMIQSTTVNLSSATFEPITSTQIATATETTMSTEATTSAEATTSTEATSTEATSTEAITSTEATTNTEATTSTEATSTEAITSTEATTNTEATTSTETITSTEATTNTEATTSTDGTISSEITTVAEDITSNDAITSTENTDETTTRTDVASTEIMTSTSETITVTTDSNIRPTVSPNDGCSLVNCGKFIESEYAVHLSNPLDCGSFCKCDWGKAYYFSCPSGLHFNADLQICDWESNAGCNVKSTLPAEPETTTITADTTTITPIVTQISTDHNLNGCEQVLCPVLNGHALHFPNPMDCSSFCKCDWGSAVYFKCPEGLHFDPKLQLCNWPKFVRCE